MMSEVQFCVVMRENMELAMITPPVGLNLFVVSAMAKAKLEEVVKGVWPFILIETFAQLENQIPEARIGDFSGPPAPAA